MIAATMLRRGARVDSGRTGRVFCALVSGRASSLTRRTPNLDMVSSHACVQATAHLFQFSERSPLLLSKRWLSTASGPPPPKAEKAGADSESDETQLAPLTTAQKMQVGFNLTLWAAGIGLACACGYFIIRELMPTKMSPNRIFDTALEVVRRDDTIRRYYGEPLKGYGRDHGGHREGRRNFIENSAYEEKTDGSKRVRVRFNVKGPYAEVSSLKRVYRTRAIYCAGICVCRGLQQV